MVVGVGVGRITIEDFVGVAVTRGVLLLVFVDVRVPVLVGDSEGVIDAVALGVADGDEEGVFVGVPVATGLRVVVGVALRDKDGVIVGVWVGTSE